MTKLFKTAMMSMFLMGAATASAVTMNEMIIGDSFIFGAGNGTAFYYTPTSDGQLTFVTDSGNYGFLYTGWAGDEPSGNALNPLTGDNTTFTFEVSANVTYYTWTYFGSISVSSTSFVADATTGNFTPLRTEEMEMGKTYTSSDWAWATEGDISGPTLCLTFSPETNGRLTLDQNTTDGHMYTTRWNMKSTFDTYNNVFEGSYSSGSNAVFYNVSAGETYYFYAKNEAVDGLTRMTPTFESAGEIVVNDVVFNQPFNAYNSVWKYIPEVTGIMTVAMSAPSYGLASSSNSFVYSTVGHSQSSQVFPINGVMNSEDNSYQFMVNAGQPVYFYQSTFASTTFTVTKVVEQLTPVVSLDVAKCLPAPGEGGLDDFSYVGGINIALSPGTDAVSVTSAKFQYISAIDGSVVSTPIDVQFIGGSAGGFWSCPVRDLYIEAIQGAAKPASMCSVVLEGIRLNGILAETSSLVSNPYVICNGSNIEVQYYVPDEYGFQLSKAVWPDMIYAEWPEAGQSNGIATLIFNNNIKAVNSVTMIYGTHYWGSSSGEAVDPTYIVPFTIEGNTLTLDFTAAYEDPNIIVDSTKSYSNVTVFVNGIQNEYGILWGEDGLNTLTEYIQFSTGSAPEPAPTMDKGVVLSPLDGNTYAIDDEFGGFILTYWDAEEGGVSLVNVANNTVDLYVGGNLAGQVPVSINGQQISIELGEYAGKNAEYMIWIPQGLVQNAEGLVNPAQSVSCKVLESNDQYLLDPTDGSELLENEIKITYPNSTLLVNDSCPEPITWAYNRYMGNVSVAGDSFIVPLDLSVMELGEYELVIPATYFVINASSLNTEIRASFIVTEKSTGIANSFADETGVVTVYNLNGVKVLETADKAQLNNLGKGLYIINGKKVIVK